MATEDNWEDIIRTNYTDLLKMIDTDNGLLGEIRKLKIFSPIALKSFWDLKDKTERIDKMLRNLQRKDYESFALFCRALEGSEQKHVVKNHLSRVKDVCSRPTLVTDSPAESDSTHNRGISREMKECFQQHWNDLIAYIEFNEDLFGELEKYKIMTPIQLNKLRDKATEAERTEYMLNILERGSVKQFESFRSALTNCNQHHIADDYLKPRSVGQQHQAMSRSTSLANPRPAGNVTDPRLPGGNPTSSASPQSAPVGRVAPFPYQQQQETQLNVERLSVNIEELRVKINEQVRLGGVYKCDRRPRGRAVIINNEYFVADRLSQREGSRNDVRLLQDLFKYLHFDPKVYEEKTDEDILKILKDESKHEGNLQCDMFVLFIMSHGIHGEIFGMNGQPVKTEKIMELFDGKNCHGLLNKPKLIFIQACQGELKTLGVPTDEDSLTVTDFGKRDDLERSLPLKPLPVYQNDALPSETVHEKADIALIYATVKDHVAWRRRDTGSLFVKYIDEVFRSKAREEDLMSMLTEVFKRLHGHIDDDHHYKQIGEKRDTLRRKVYLLP